MINKIFFFYKFLISIILIAQYSCNSGNKKNNNPEVDNHTNILNNSNNNSFEAEGDSRANVLYNKLAKLLHLDNIKSKATGTELRIWYQYADSARLIQILEDNDEWNFFGYEIKLIYTEMDIVAVDKKIYTNKPLNGWSNFLKLMDIYGFKNLKNVMEDSTYSLSLGGQYLYLELIHENKYNYYLYLNYEDNEDNFIEIRNVLSIIFLIQREFGFRLFPM